MSSHTIAARTTKRALSQFFWPGVTQHVRMYCRTCNGCQRTADKGRIPSSPFQQMPLIEEPFKRVAIDSVGPFEPLSERGHRYILTVIDVASRFPEAVPFKRIDTPATAEALFSNRGTQFPFNLMQEVFRLVSVDHLTTSPYHAQTNEMVERFNGTLKTMLRKMASEKPKNWERYVPAFLFAYREMPNESTGFHRLSCCTVEMHVVL